MGLRGNDAQGICTMRDLEQEVVLEEAEWSKVRAYRRMYFKQEVNDPSGCCIR